MFTRTCIRCGVVITYETQDELLASFYFKNGYYRNVCKTCEKKEHKEKYKAGAYNYKRKLKTDVNDSHTFSLGSLDSGSLI